METKFHDIIIMVHATVAESDKKKAIELVIDELQNNVPNRKIIEWNQIIKAYERQE